MATTVQHRRGTTAQHAAFTGAEGELTYNTTTKTVHTHDGVTSGGFSLVKSSDLSASVGSSLVGYLPSGIGAVSRTTQDKLRESVSVKDFGAVGDGVTDDTAAIQAAITEASIYGGEVRFPAGKYRTTATLTVNKGVTLYGAGFVVKDPLGIEVFKGSWLFFDHTGKGISAVNSGGAGVTCFAVKNLATCRTQPEPTSGWAPTAHDFDIYSFGFYDVTVSDSLLLNPTKGVGFFGDVTNSAGRLNIYNVKMQAFTVGVQINTAYDVCRIENLHVWPFWRDNAFVHAYTLANLDAIYLLRSDNPLISNVFTIFARAGLRLGKNVNGQSQKVHVSNTDFDRGVYGIWVDSTCDAVTGQFSNITCQGEAGVLLSKSLFVEGSNTTIAFTNFNSKVSYENAVKVAGSGNYVTFAGQLHTKTFNISAANYAAIDVDTSNTVQVDTYIDSDASGPLLGGPGAVLIDEWVSYTPTVTSGSGALGALTVNSAKYKRTKRTVTVKVDITITSIGTGASSIRVTLPTSTSLTRCTGWGREVAISGTGLTTTLTNGETFFTVYTINNTFPVSNGSRIVCGIVYDI